MFHSRIVAKPVAQPPRVHSFYCGCHSCHQSRDPIGFTQARRTVRLQAIAFIAFLAVIYGLVAANAAGIAASFAVSL